MDHLRLSEINFRNAKQMKVLGNREMEQAYQNLAKFHENLHAEQYAREAALEAMTIADEFFDNSDIEVQPVNTKQREAA